MRIVRRALLAGVVGLMVSAAIGATAGAGAGRAQAPVSPAIAAAWVQPPAWIPIAAPAPRLPGVVGAAHLWVQPPAWIPIAA